MSLKTRAPLPRNNGTSLIISSYLLVLANFCCFMLFLLCFDINELELKFCAEENKVICINNKMAFCVCQKEGGSSIVQKEFGNCAFTQTS